MRQGSLDYKINSMENVSEIYSTGFNITVPEDTHYPDQVTGTHRAGAHGWFVFPQNRYPQEINKLYYNAGVTLGQVLTLVLEIFDITRKGMGAICKIGVFSNLKLLTRVLT